jgi:hypothetical protein
MMIDMLMYTTGMKMLNAADLQTYTAEQVASLADVDVYAVRAEGERRQASAEKKLARLMKQIEAAKKEMADGETILRAAFAEMKRAA